MRIFLSVILFWMSLSFCFCQDNPFVMNLWPNVAPGEEVQVIGPESIKEAQPGQKEVMRITNVSQPSITVYLTKVEKNVGTAILVCPGGGYNILAYEHEGTEVCEWLNKQGINSILLKYRVPRRKGRLKYEAPLEDVQRAMGIIRRNSEKWKIKADRIGILGFSAGGHLALMALTSPASRSYEKIDAYDGFACRPNFGILIYPAYLVDSENKNRLLPEVQINSKTPPCFFAHAGDDHVPVQGSALAYLALENSGVIGNELHLHAFGGHGYGMRHSKNTISDWPWKAKAWMSSMGWLRAPGE